MADARRIKWTELVKGLRNVEVGKPLDLEVQRETIPIVFVPGIMGSRLKKDGEKVWDPDDGAFMFWNYGLAWVGPAEKKAALIGDAFDPERLVPLDDDAKHNEKFSAGDWGRPSTWPNAARRGWGTVAWGTYREVLLKLQSRETWQARGDGAAPLDAFFEFPVYAFGYNWTASNVDSGRKLAARIEEIVDAHRSTGGICEKAIVVTHSMGGLVARWAVEREGAKDKVLGVVHGVQPAVGAAAAYWRMKAGFERGRVAGFELPSPMAWVLGTNGSEVTALLGWMPGGLELLPSPDYTDNKGSKKWLRIHDNEGAEVAAYGDDACEQIYKNKDPEAYWRLIEKKYLLPEERPRLSPARAWKQFVKRIDRAKSVHGKLSGKARPETQGFYGAGKRHPSCDRIEYRAVVYDWRAAAKDAATVAKVVRMVAAPGVGTALAVGFELFKRTEWWQSRGAFKLRIDTSDGEVDVEMQHPHALTKLEDDPHGAGAGDGTVPESSGKALKQRGDAVGSERDARAFEGISHEPAFHADQRGLAGKAKGWAKEQFGADPYAPPEDNTVSFTVASVRRLLALEIKKARG